MPTSDARIKANQANSSKSTGPRTEAGKEHSRANSYKHGMTGAGVVLSEADAIEVDRRSLAFVEELSATGEVEISLARRAALNSVRMERGADQQTAALNVRVRQAEADFAPPEGVDDEEAARLRLEAGRSAMFDPSKEAGLARAYEASAERGFYRALKELRQIQKQAKVEIKAQVQQTEAVDPEVMLASFLKMQEKVMKDGAEFDAMLDEIEARLDRLPSKPPQFTPLKGVVGVPIKVGRRR